MSKPDFSKRSDYLDEDSQREAKVLLAKRDEILDQLVAVGLTEDEEHPYTYNIPTTLSFECGHGKDFPMTSLYAIVVMARASHADAHWLDTDAEGYPEIGPIGSDNTFHRVHITDPFAWHIDDAIKRFQERLGKAGKPIFATENFIGRPDGETKAKTD